MQVSSSTASHSSSNANASNASKDLDTKYNNFLLLLTKQLQNQDPLSPLDTNQFTQQLVAFSNVEQAIQTNQRLEQLIALQSNNNAYGAVNFLGRQIAYEDNQIALQKGQAQFAYSVDHVAAKAVLTITDATGRLVASRVADSGIGSHRLAWDGKDDTGTTLPDGTYRVAVTVFDAKGQSSQASVTGIGKVDGTSLENGEVKLFIGNLTVPLAKVTQVAS